MTLKDMIEKHLIPIELDAAKEPEDKRWIRTIEYKSLTLYQKIEIRNGLNPKIKKEFNLFSDTNDIPEEILNKEVISVYVDTQTSDYYIINAIRPENCEEYFKETHTTIKDALHNEVLIRNVLSYKDPNTKVTVDYSPYLDYKAIGIEELKEDFVQESFINEIKVKNHKHRTLNISLEG